MTIEITLDFYVFCKLSILEFQIETFNRSENFEKRFVIEFGIKRNEFIDKKPSIF